MHRKDLRILIILVLLSYLITMALTRPTARVLPAPGPTRTPWPTFAIVEPSPLARVLAPTSTPRPTTAAMATATPFPPRAPSTPAATLPPTATVIPSPTVPAAATHVVSVGENLTSIAQQYGITIQAIVKANGLSDPDRLLPDQILIIPLPHQPSPGPAATSLPSAAVPPSPPVPATVTHVVRAGENLTGIAQHYGITIQAIVEANGLSDPDRLLPDQILIIPRPGEP